MSDVSLPVSHDGAASRSTLFERRLPQIALAYLGGSWTIFQFVIWTTDRFVLSPHLQDLTLLALVLMLPTVLMLGWRHGARGRQKWSRLESIGVPCNLAGAAVVLALFFGGKDLGSAQETVVLQGADGEVLERVVPKATFRKRLALFYPTPASADSSAHDLSLAFHAALRSDLQQDLFVTVATPSSSGMADELRKTGFADGYGEPLALQRQLADDEGMDRFLRSAVTETADGGYQAHLALHRTRDGDVLAERTLEASSLFELADQASRAIREDLEVPSSHLDSVLDLPASEVTTSSLPALVAYARAIHTGAFSDDVDQTLVLLEEATALDPTFALAYLYQFNALRDAYRMEEAKAAVGMALQHGYRLTEQNRYLARTVQLFYEQQPGAALLSAEQWTTLFPDDPLAWQLIAELYALRGERDEALAAQERVVELDPEDGDAQLALGQAQVAANQWDDALATYRRYTERHPQQREGYRQMGMVYQQQGRLEERLHAYEQALATGPRNPSALQDMAYALWSIGRFEEAEERLDEALHVAATPHERTLAHQWLAQYQMVRGRNAEAVASFEQVFEVMATFRPEADLLRARMSVAYVYAYAGRHADAAAVIAEAKAHPSMHNDPFYTANALLYEALYLAAVDRAPEAVEPVDAAIALLEEYEIDEAASGLMELKGTVLVEAGEYAEAEGLLRPYLDRQPAAASGWVALGQALLGLQRAEEAAEAFREALRFEPLEGAANLGMAQALLAQDRPEEAASYLEQALTTWADADSNYGEAAEARALRASLNTPAS